MDTTESKGLKISGIVKLRFPRKTLPYIIALDDRRGVSSVIRPFGGALDFQLVRIHYLGVMISGERRKFIVDLQTQETVAPDSMIRNYTSSLERRKEFSQMENWHIVRNSYS